MATVAPVPLNQEWRAARLEGSLGFRALRTGRGWRIAAQGLGFRVRSSDVFWTLSFFADGLGFCAEPYSSLIVQLGAWRVVVPFRVVEFVFRALSMPENSYPIVHPKAQF